MSGDNKEPVIISSNIIDDENESFEFIPISGDDLGNKDIKVPEVLPILTLKNTVLFPGVIIPITVGRDKSIKLIKDHHKTTKIVGVVSQKDANIEEPNVNDLNTIGTVAVILKMFRLPDGNTTVIIQGKKRFQINEVLTTEPYITARVTELKESKIDKKDREIGALLDSIKEIANKFIQLSPNIPSEAVGALRNINDPIFLVHFISSNLGVSLLEKQSILEIPDFKERAEKVLSFVTKDLQLLEMKTEIQNKARQEIDKQQREYFIQQQIKAFQDELGHESPDREIANMKERAAKKVWAEYVAKHFQKELEKIQRLNPMSPEFGTQMNYLQLLLDLPWSEKSKDNFDLKHAKKILDEDHYGLDKIKDRILEYLAVIKLKGNMKSPILCLYGPPGVGKTSLGKSIAKAIGRKYVRMSIGGLHDEAEIRGHRKTYIGAMPISNTIWGGSINYQKPSGFITKMVDKLPFISTKTPSKLRIDAEFAQFIPGHSRAVGKAGTSYIDDFEGAKSTISLTNIASWSIASAPQGQTTKFMFPEAAPGTGLAYGYNRAKMAWYSIDPSVFYDKSNTRRPKNISKDELSRNSSRVVYENELFPNKENQYNQPLNINILNVAYFPGERGPYNYDVNAGTFSRGINDKGGLEEPYSRWAGMMRKMETSDFEAANVEYITFWLMDPFSESTTNKGGELFFNLGDISEDILRDGRKAFENGLPSSDLVTDVDTTIWGRVPVKQALTVSFDSKPESRPFQDVGYERLFRQVFLLLLLHYSLDD